MEFTTEIGASSISVYGGASLFPIGKEDNCDIETQDTTIRWSVDFEVREWGIKYASVGVKELPIGLTFKQWQDEGKDIETEITIVAKETPVLDGEYELKWEVIFNEDGGFTWHEIDIDCKTKTVTLR